MIRRIEGVGCIGSGCYLFTDLHGEGKHHCWLLLLFYIILQDYWFWVLHWIVTDRGAGCSRRLFLLGGSLL